MKKLIMFVLALAMVVAFMPKVYAGDSAQLNLSVTFAADQDLQRVEELKALINEISEKGGSIFGSIYQDRNNDGEVNGDDMDINADGVIDTADVRLVQEAIHNMKNLPLGPSMEELKDILARRPDLKELINSVLATAGEVLNKLSECIARLTDLLHQIPPPIIAIELNESAWRLDGVKLGELRDNLAYFGASTPLHMVKNTGNILVMIEIGYGPSVGPIQPGIRQDVDRFITGVGRVDNHVLIPPDSRTFVGMAGPGEQAPLWLTYGSPTALSEDVTVTYYGMQFVILGGIQYSISVTSDGCYKLLSDSNSSVSYYSDGKCRINIGGVVYTISEGSDGRLTFRRLAMGMSATYEIRAYGEYPPIEKN